jgi:hypothetical protein
MIIGKYLIHERDKTGHFIIIIRAKLLGKHTYTNIETCMAAITFAFEK